MRIAEAYAARSLTTSARFRKFAIVAALIACGASSPGGAAAQTLDLMAASGLLRIGYVADQAPFASTGEDGEPVGYAIELCRMIVTEIGERTGGAEVALSETTLAAAFDDIADNRLDMLCGAISITLDRREIVDFSEPIFVTGASALIRTDSPRDLRELFLGERTISPPRSPTLRPFSASRIGVRSDTTTEIALRAVVERDGYKVAIEEYPTHADGLAALQSRRIDAYFGDRALLMGLVEKSDDAEDLVVGTRLLTREAYGIALRRGDADFRLEIDRVLTNFYATPAFAELLSRYFPGDAAALQAQILEQATPE